MDKENQENQTNSNEFSENEKQMSALEHNIKTKGQNAYYYAHGRKYEMENNQEGKTIQGPGIITGGDPVLLAKTEKEIIPIKTAKIFDKYQFCDDDDFVEIKINLANYFKDPSKITNEFIQSKIEEKNLKICVTEPDDSEPRQLVVLKLFKKIIPEKSTVSIIKQKSLVIKLKKAEADEEWDKLNA